MKRSEAKLDDCFFLLFLFRLQFPFFFLFINGNNDQRIDLENRHAGMRCSAFPSFPPSTLVTSTCFRCMSREDSQTRKLAGDLVQCERYDTKRR